MTTYSCLFDRSKLLNSPELQAHSLTGTVKSSISHDDIERQKLI